MAAKRNPGVSWPDPIQAQNQRRQARFLLLVEQAAAIRKGFTADASLLLHPITRPVLEAAGVPLEQLNPDQPATSYAAQIEEIVKTPWTENKKHPHWSVMEAASQAFLKFSLTLNRLEVLNQHFTSHSGAEAGRNAELKFKEHLPTVELAWRHRCTDYAKQLGKTNEMPDGFPRLFNIEHLDAIKAAITPAIDKIRDEYEAIRDARKAEYRDRFGHQPSANAGAAQFEEEMYEIFGKTVKEFMAGIGFNQGRFSGSSTSPAGQALAADLHALGVAPGASQEEIQTAFRKLAKQHHPDAGGDAAKFQAVADAYSRLREVAS